MSRELVPPVSVTDPADSHLGCGATIVNPQPYCDRLAASAQWLNAARCLSRQLHALAEEALMMTNEQVADQLLALADQLRALP